jgi:hypothetical protein
MAVNYWRSLLWTMFLDTKHAQRYNKIDVLLLKINEKKCLVKLEKLFENLLEINNQNDVFEYFSVQKKHFKTTYHQIT